MGKKKYNKNIVKFHLKEKNVEKGKTQIFLIFFKKGIKLRYYIQRRIEPGFWDFTSQRANSLYPSKYSLNKFLNTIANHLEDEYNKLDVLGEKITLERLRNILDERIRKEDKKESFTDKYDEFIKTSKNVRRLATIKSHKTTKQRLIDFEYFKNIKLTFDSIDSKFDVEFRDFLISERKLTNNTISKYYRTFKVFMNWAVEKGYTKNILKILNFKSSGQNKLKVKFIS